VAEPVPPRHRRRERRRARPARPADGTPREYARAAPEAPTEVGPPGGADGTERDGTERDGTQRDGTQRDGTERSDLPAEPRRARRPRRAEGERNLRGIVGPGSSQVGVVGAMRARDAARPTAADLAEAERDVVIVRRHYVPPNSLPGTK